MRLFSLLFLTLFFHFVNMYFEYISLWLFLKLINLFNADISLVLCILILLN